MVNLLHIIWNILTHWSVFFLLPLLTALLAMALTRLGVFVLPKVGLVAKVTGGRHIHTREVALGGGIAMVLAFSAAVLCSTFWAPSRWLPIATPEAGKLLLPLLILVPLGIIDDRWGVPAKVKLAMQMLAALCCWSLGVRFTSILGLPCNTTVSLLITVFWITATINAFNLIDGVDGLASGVAGISAICLGGILMLKSSHPHALIMFCLAGCCLGFLRYNMHPARIFMGDTGSMFLGYALGALGIITCTKIATVSAIVVPILACGIPILDTALAIWRRVTYKMLHNDDPNVGIMSADRNHLHHRLLAYFKNNQPRTVGVIYILATLLAMVAVLSIYLPRHLPSLAFFLALIAFSLVIHRLAVIEFWNSSELVSGSFSLARTGTILNIIHPLWDLGVIVLAFLISARHSHFGSRNDLYMLLLWVTPVFIAMILSRNYHIFWNHASIEDYFHILLYLAIGFFAAWMLAQLPRVPRGNADLFFTAFALTALGIEGERLFIPWLRSTLIKYRYRSPLTTEKSAGVLVYGICSAGRTYIREYICNTSRDHTEYILGFIDRDKTYTHGYCVGYKVLGDIQSMEKIFAQTPFRKLAICKFDLSSDEMKMTQGFCNAHDIAIVCYSYREETL